MKFYVKHSNSTNENLVEFKEKVDKKIKDDIMLVYVNESTLYNCAGKVEKCLIENDSLCVDVKLLNTPTGKVVEKILLCNPNMIKIVPQIILNVIGYDISSFHFNYN